MKLITALTKNMVMVAIFGMLTMFAAPAKSTMILAYDNYTMAEKAKAIVIGQVEYTDTYLYGGNIFTKVSLRVDEDLKNKFQSDSYIDLEISGGTYGEMTEEIHGAPQFVKGEKVLLFVEEVMGRNIIMGLSFGKFNITAGLNPFVFRDMREISAVKKDQTGKFVNLDPLKLQVPKTLSEFKAELEGYLRDIRK